MLGLHSGLIMDLRLRTPHDWPSHPNVVSARFADHKLRFNLRIVGLKSAKKDLARTESVRQRVSGNFYWLNFAQALNTNTLRCGAFSNSTYV